MINFLTLFQGMAASVFGDQQSLHTCRNSLAAEVCFQACVDKVVRWSLTADKIIDVTNYRAN